MMVFKDEFRKRRELLGFTQKTLADALKDTYKIPNPTIEKWEAGIRTPPEYTQLLLLEMLDKMFDSGMNPDSKEALSIEELRQLNQPVWCSGENKEGTDGYWCLCVNGKILCPSGKFLKDEEFADYHFLRQKPKKP